MARSTSSMADGTDAWTRAARQAQQEATYLGLTLTDEELILRDVRDLQALYAGLHRRRVEHTGTFRVVLHALSSTA